MDAALRIMKYIKNHPGQGMLLSNGQNTNISAYCDITRSTSISFIGRSDYHEKDAEIQHIQHEKLPDQQLVHEAPHLVNNQEQRRLCKDKKTLL